MESNSGGGHLGGVAVSLGNGLGGGGGGGQNIQQLLQQQPPHWASQQQQHFFNTEFGSGQQQQGGPGGQQQLQQLMQQQQLMQLAAAQAAGNGPGQQGPPGSGQLNQMGPTLNMIMQGMQAAAAAQGLPHTLQSPPNSGPGFLLLPGLGHHHQGQQGRDISPNSTPSLSGGHPPPSATPPNMTDLSDRNWASQAPQHNLLFGGPRIMNHPDKLDDMSINHQMALAAAAAGQRGMNDLFHGEPFANLGQHSRQQQQEHPMPLNQIPNIDMALARGLNPYQYVPAHSPPHMFHQQMAHQMPPRPRPEGGQDPSPNFLNEQNDSHPHQMGQQQPKKDDLVIGSWTDEDVEKIPQQQQQANQQQQQQQHMFPPNFMMQQRPPMIEDKEPTGWGAPPPPNTTAAGGWGATTHAPPPPHPTQHPPPNQGLPPRKPNWQQGNIFDAPPPMPLQAGPPPHTPGRGGPRGAGGDRNRFNDYDGQGRGNDARGGRGGYRGRGGGGPRLNVDHSQEKVDGKKSAIAETIAMMNKMKMEDKERKDAARQREEKRRELNPDDFSSPDDCKEPHPDEPAPPRRHGFRERGSYDYRGRGGRGGRGNKFNPGPNNGPIGLPMPGGHGPISPGGGLFMSPPTGGIPPFPGLENFMGGPPATFPGSYPAGPGNPFYGMNPGQFNPSLRGFPRGGGNRGQLQFGFPGPRGPFMPPMMPRHGGPMILPRGALGGRGMGRIGGRGQRGGRGGRGGGSYYGNKENGSIDHGGSADKSVDDDEVRNDVEEFDRGQAEGGESDDAGAGKAGEADGGSLSEEPPKNAISEQVFG